MEGIYTIAETRSADIFQGLSAIKPGKVGATQVVFPSTELPEWLVPVILSKARHILQPISTSGSGTASNYPFMTQLATNISAPDIEMEQLAKAAESADDQLFVSLADAMDWEHCPVEDYLAAIQLALSAGAHFKARNLALRGGERFPDHPEMQKYAHILAPAKVIQKHLPADPEGARDIRWLKENHDTYLGQWVALRHGELLASASSYKELIVQIESPKVNGILITPVY